MPRRWIASALASARSGGGRPNSASSWRVSPSALTDFVGSRKRSAWRSSVPRSSTYALSNVTLPYVLALADHGWRDACRHDPALAKGLTTHDGVLTSPEVADAHGYDATPLDEALSG